MAESQGFRDLMTLLSLDKKSDLIRYAKGMTITGDDLVRLIVGAEASLIGYGHEIYHRQILPEQLRITAQDLVEMANAAKATGVVHGKGLSTLNKVKQSFKDRRLLAGHMFSDAESGRWHFFYFDQRDYSESENHWEQGAHIHFLNHLWPEYSMDDLGQQFAVGNPKFRGSVHIRFEDTRTDV